MLNFEVQIYSNEKGDLIISFSFFYFFYRTIVIENIKNITVEDASSIEKKITVGRLLLVGVFALAWRKKKTNELAFVVTEWNDGKFDHSTTFSFEGKEAMTKANTARNSLIKMCN